MRYEITLGISIIFVFLVGVVGFGMLAIFSPDTLTNNEKQLHIIQTAPAYPTSQHQTPVAIVNSAPKPVKESPLTTILKDPKAMSWYIEVYEPNPRGGSIKITTSTKEPGPVVLHVNSYEPVIWDLASTYMAPLAAIVISGYQPGTAINVPPETKVFYESDITVNQHNGDFTTTSTLTHTRAYRAKAIQLPGGDPRFVTE